MEVIVTQAWKLLETIRRNRENWGFSEIRHLQMGSKMFFQVACKWCCTLSTKVFQLQLVLRLKFSVAS
jgi:hypothetical protein